MSKLIQHGINPIFQIRYFSFFLGAPGDLKSTWIFEDVKIAARDVKQAIVFHSNLFDPRRLVVPSSYMVNQSYRMIIEYEQVKARGFTLIQFKKVKAHTVYSILAKF